MVVVLVLVLVVVVVVVGGWGEGGGGGGGGGVILGEVKARPKDIISFSLDYISKSKVQTSNPSSSPIPLDTPARPADFLEIFPCKFTHFTNAQIGFMVKPLDGRFTTDWTLG